MSFKESETNSITFSITISLYHSRIFSIYVIHKHIYEHQYIHIHKHSDVYVYAHVYDSEYFLSVVKTAIKKSETNSIIFSITTPYYLLEDFLYKQYTKHKQLLTNGNSC